MGHKSKNKFYGFIKYFLFFVAIILLAGYIYFDYTYPKTAPAPQIEVYTTPAQIERGKYLANNVSICISCHSVRDWTKFSGPVIPGTEGMGGQVFENGYPGIFYAGNITPSGIGEWSDGDLLRTITTGVTPDNRVLYPVMPYPEYHNLSIDDLNSIIGYIKTLTPIVNEVPVSSIDFPMNFIVRTLPPESYIPITSTDESNSMEYGKYLVSIAVCKSCHTLMDGGKFKNAMDFAGGPEFKTNGKIIRSSNITPDIETGIGSWTKEDFLNRFKHYTDYDFSSGLQNLNTPMPWTAYSQMTDNDLNSIYDYLKTVPPVHNKVMKFENN